MSMYWQLVLYLVGCLSFVHSYFPENHRHIKNFDMLQKMQLRVGVRSLITIDGSLVIHRADDLSQGHFIPDRSPLQRQIIFVVALSCGEASVWQGILITRYIWYGHSCINKLHRVIESANIYKHYSTATNLSHIIIAFCMLVHSLGIYLNDNRFICLI